jgi:hypothetical protein
LKVGTLLFSTIPPPPLISHFEHFHFTLVQTNEQGEPSASYKQTG